MRSPLIALTWEIWRRNRLPVWLVIGILSFGWLFQLVSPDSLGARAVARVNTLLCVASLLLVFGIFNYTEFNRQKEWTGFPYRLFALPVSTFQLVALPMWLGVAAVELVYLAWAKFIFAYDGVPMQGWVAVLLGAYMVFFQAILWTLAGFRILRLVVLGMTGTSFIAVGLLPLFGRYISSRWFSEKILIALLVGLALSAFLAAWACLARQRCGGGRRRNWIMALIDKISDALPRRSKGFASPARAQFWFEWRRSGLLLPIATGALLLFVIGPLSWLTRKDSDSALWILGWTLAMPVILAAPIGKGSSKPDFWSSDLSLPAFLAIRPLATGEMVVTKMKVAAFSAAISWLLVAVFLAVWLPLWADLEQLSTIRIGFWMIFYHSVFAQYVIAALAIIAGLLLTWKFLVGGLWIGLSGNRKLFIASAAAYSFVLLLGMIGVIISINYKEVVVDWIEEDPDQPLALLEWLAASAVIAKFWLAACSWGKITPKRTGKFLLVWMGATFCLLTLAILLWAAGRFYFSLDVYRLRNLLILVALLLVPFARLGLAPSTLAKNRHA